MVTRYLMCAASPEPLLVDSAAFLPGTTRMSLPSVSVSLARLGRSPYGKGYEVQSCIIVVFTDGTRETHNSEIIHVRNQRRFLCASTAVNSPHGY